MFLEINGIKVTRVSNDAVYDFVIAVTIGSDEVGAIASDLRSLVEH